MKVLNFYIYYRKWSKSFVIIITIKLYTLKFHAQISINLIHFEISYGQKHIYDKKKM